MKCERARELASEALDGELTAGATGDFERHLSDCPPCRTFYAELRESLLLLEDLPVVEVSDQFNAAVWSRIRAEEAPESLWDGWRVRLENWAERFRMTAPAWKWSPVGVAAALGMFVWLSSGPMPASWSDAGDSSIAAVGDEKPADRSAAERARSTEAPPVASVTRMETAVASADGEIPDAIERFLQRSESRELSLEGGTDRYRHVNYSYPLRRVPDPSARGGDGALPVSGQRVFGPRRPDTMPRGAVLPVAQPVSAGAEVIAF